ncbi:MAG: carbonic anhydrase [Planctomycetota bacterium]|nr:carbonic anhydrase [Planctomycetota bacterium]
MPRFACLLSLFCAAALAASEPAAPAKPGPDAALKLLKEGNARFAAGKSEQPRTDAARIKLAGQADQGDYAYATVLACSDSRVPVERLFDAGVMDLFVVRVAGNVVDTDEAGSIEYGLAHVKTPVLVVLGHTQCGAVTAVTQAALGHGHALERNIPPLVANIGPAVERTRKRFPDLKEGDLIARAIEENVWQGVEDLFMGSPATRQLVKEGKAKVVGAIYDVGAGGVTWLDEKRAGEILKQVEKHPDRAMDPMAAPAHGEPKQENPDSKEPQAKQEKPEAPARREERQPGDRRRWDSDSNQTPGS